MLDGLQILCSCIEAKSGLASILLTFGFFHVMQFWEPLIVWQTEEWLEFHPHFVKGLFPGLSNKIMLTHSDRAKLWSRWTARTKI